MKCPLAIPIVIGTNQPKMINWVLLTKKKYLDGVRESSISIVPLKNKYYKQMKDLFYIFIGGGAGSVLRFMVSKNLNLIYQIPLGTLIVNVLGSFILGLFLGYVVKNQTLGPFLFLFTVGFCGGFTTFSTFAAENFTYLKNEEYLLFALYTIGSLSLTILGVYLGFLLIKSLPV